MTPSPSGGAADHFNRFSFHLGQPSAPITPDSLQWHDALPLHRQELASSSISAAGKVTYGDYFTAAGEFLSQKSTVLLRSAERLLKRRLPPEGLTEIQIHLIKHGALYHPAKILLAVGHDQLPMVLNVAVSEAGRERLPQEAAHLDHLHRHYPETYLPVVFGSGVGQTANGRTLPMFAGQWLDRYYEVHRSPNLASEGQQRWCVWDTDEGDWFLTDRQTAQLFRQAAFILTYYFDPHTLSAIRQWHHAAGDFVMRQKEDDIDVRLITVRSYAPLIQLDADDVVDLEILFDALAVFLMQTALWLRIDRLDGVGDLVWADGRVLAPIWSGFVQGLARIAEMNGFPTEFTGGVTTYLANHSTQDLLDLGLQIAARYPAGLPEAALMRDKLPAHAGQLAAVIKSG